MHRSLALLAGLLCSAVLAAEPPKKLIATGWDSPTPARFRAELVEFERWPFDGAVIVPTRRVGGEDVKSHLAFSREHWERAEFDTAIADLRAATPRTATHNFLAVYANPGDVDWFDDAGWREIVEHWRLLAAAARAGGMRGLLFDAEPYTKPHEPFRYAAQTGRREHSFAEYRAKARERGRDTMRAVAAEFPAATILTYRLLCDVLPALAPGADADAVLEGQGYGLLPAFLDGWLDAMPAGLTVVEGNENAYLYRSEAEFAAAAAQLKIAAPLLVSPENRAKFRAQVLLAHGIYLDAHTNPPGHAWHVPPLEGSPAARLESNVAAALRHADEYVWIYGEAARWWPGKADVPLWPEKMPGADRALRFAKNPVAAARETRGENLLRNGAFSDSAAHGQLPHWWTWQDEKSRGKFSLADGAAILRAMRDGCLGQGVRVRPGERYAVSARLRRAGGGTAGVAIRWKTPAGVWIAEGADLHFTPPRGEGWQEIAGVALVPESAGELIVLLCAKQQDDEADRAEFDDVALVKMAR